MNSKVRWVAIVVVVGALIGGLLIWWNSRSGGSCDVPQSVAEGPAVPAGRAPGGGGGLRVQDQGFSWTPEPVNNSFHLVSVGATVQNPTDMIAYHTTLTITLLDGAGKSLTYKSFPHSTSLAIPVILPGQRVNFGDELIPEVGGFIFGSHNEALEPGIKRKYGDAGPVASVRIGLNSTHWLPRDALGADFGSATAKVTVFDVKYRSVHYVVHAAGCGKPAPGYSVVVFRDASGAVVGGATGTGSGSCGTAEPSTYETYLVTNAPPPARAVADRSEVSLHCDVGPLNTPSSAQPGS